MALLQLLLCSLVFNVVLTHTAAQTIFRFTEVTQSAGLGQALDFTDKVSGPSVGDIDGDGYLDIVQANHARKPITVFYGRASGIFRRKLVQSRVGTGFGTGDRHGTSIGDWDNDGDLDLVVAMGFNNQPALLFRNTGGQTLEELTALQSENLGLDPFTNTQSMHKVRLVDIDRDLSLIHI